MCYYVVTGGDDMIMRGRKINSLVELKQNFSIDELIYCYYSGELEIWLRRIGECEIADKLLTLPRNAYLLIHIYEALKIEPELTDEQIRKLFRNGISESSNNSYKI